MPTNVKTMDDVKIKNINIIELEYENLPYTYDFTISLDENYPKDSTGVILFNHKGTLYYHPVQIAQKMLVLIDSYTHTQNKAYLD